MTDESSNNLGNQSTWHIFKYLVRIGDFPGAINVLFWKRTKKQQ
jgi:hypothetical protein